MSWSRSHLEPDQEVMACSHPPGKWQQRFRDGGMCGRCFRFLWGYLKDGRHELPEDLRRPAEPAPAEVGESLFDMEDY